MHAVGLHSALAISRQRKRREEQKRARERRFSSHSNDSNFNTPRNSIVSLEGGHLARHRAHGQRKPGLLGTKVVTSVGMLHIGVVFLVLGLFLVVSAILPATDDDSMIRTKNSKQIMIELLFSGIFCVCLGILLIVLNQIVSKKADDDLNSYVTGQLTRSKSGTRLVRDAETGHMTSNNPRRKENSAEELQSNGSAPREVELADVHISTHHHPHHHKSPINSPPPVMNGETPLEKIIEEDPSEYSLAAVNRPQHFFANNEYGGEKGEEESRAMDSFNKETMSNDSTTASLSPGTPSETQELLTSKSNMRMYRM